MPTSASTTYGGKKLEALYPGFKTMAVKFGNSLTIARGTILGIKTSDSKWYAYIETASDGLQVARGVAMYDMKTSSAGKVSLGDVTPGELGADELTAPVYIEGMFDTAELVGLALGAGVNEVQTITIAGTLSAGQFKVGAKLSDGSFKWSEDIAFNANLAAIQTGYDTAFGASNVVIGGTVGSHTVTFSGAGYLARDQDRLFVDANEVTGVTTVAVAETTKGRDTTGALAIAQLGRLVVGSVSAGVLKVY